MLEVPGLEPEANVVNLVILNLASLDHVGGHYNHLLGRVGDTLNKIRGVLCARSLSEEVDTLLAGLAATVLNANVRFAWDDLDLARYKETKCTVGPRESIEEFAVLGLAACNNFTRCENDFSLEDEVIKETVFMGAGLDSSAHKESTNSEIIHFRQDRDSVTMRDEIVAEMTHVNHRLDVDILFSFIQLEDVIHVDLDVSGHLLVRAKARRN